MIGDVVKRSLESPKVLIPVAELLECREPLARLEAGGYKLQSRCDRRQDPMVRRRRGPLASEEQWRKLSFFARSARSAGRGESPEDRLGRDYLAKTERQSTKN